jgi:hypothetical protein
MPKDSQKDRTPCHDYGVEESCEPGSLPWQAVSLMLSGFALFAVEAGERVRIALKT